MVNEDIITALRNSIEHGESLEQAVQVLIGSGYNAQEVNEASQFFGSGVINQTQIKPDEHLVMPEKKSFFSSSKISPQPLPTISSTNSSIPNLSSQLQKIHAPKKSHAKEIFLFILLLILIGILIVTMIYKNQIIAYFS